MRIDAHQHFWKIERGDYFWLHPDLKPLYRDYLPQDLKPHVMKHNIERTIVVQASPTVAETEYLLELYETTDFIAGIVGWLDLESVDFREHFHRLYENRGFVGIRPMLQDLEDDRWILREQVLKNLEVLIEKDFPIDILIFPRHLPVINELMNLLPDIRAVINHCAKPHISKGILYPWQEEIAELASFNKVMCKLSGLITEADHQHWQLQDFKAYVEHIFTCFGADSIMFGSDWPVCLLAGSYEDVYHIAESCIPQELSAEELDMVFGDNAKRFYKLDMQTEWKGAIR